MILREVVSEGDGWHGAPSFSMASGRTALKLPGGTVYGGNGPRRAMTGASVGAVFPSTRQRDIGPSSRPIAPPTARRTAS
jgi:hypothetical protein